MVLLAFVGELVPIFMALFKNGVGPAMHSNSWGSSSTVSETINAWALACNLKACAGQQRFSQQIRIP